MKPLNLRPFLLNVAAIIVLILIVGAYGYQQGFIFGGKIVKDSGKNISDYSAIFLANGQVYFGKVYNSKETIIDLRDIYYLQVGQNLQDATDKNDSSAKPDVNLVKLGEELHGPNDRMKINKDQVLFTESLRDDSKVVKAIGNYKSK